MLEIVFKKLLQDISQVFQVKLIKSRFQAVETKN